MPEGAQGADGRRNAAPGKRVLVVEDVPVNRALMVELLRRRGYTADAVENGAEAVEAFARVPYAAVFMDIQMPVMDGHEATRGIRRTEPPDRHTPIVAVTAHTRESDRRRALASGMDDYIPKPVRPEQLDRVLGRWVAPAPPRESPAPPAEGPLDPQVLSDLHTIVREGGAPVVAALLEAFTDETPALLATLRETATRGDAPAFRRSAHALNGLARGVGARRVGSTCAELEDLAATGDLGEAPPLLERLRLEREDARELLVAEFSG